MIKSIFSVALLVLSFSVFAAPNGNSATNEKRSANATDKTTEVAAKLAIKLADKGNNSAAEKVSPN